ncbi:hypothetical protein BH23VER1_BH23VER1_25840 [soil metagenome]
MPKPQPASHVLMDGLDAPNEAAIAGETPAITRLLADGNEAAWREFFELRHRRVRAYVSVVWRGSETAVDDIVQETFIRAAKHMRVFPNEEALWGWLTTLARSATADAGRRQGRFRRFLEQFGRERAPSEPPQHGPPDGAGIMAAMAILPDDVARLLRWKYEDGRSIASIAAELSISTKAAESRLTRARKSLRKILANSR